MKTICEFLLKNKTAVSTQKNECKPIDLGLKSGLLWADRNVGAENTTDAGDYFMWGSTEPNTNDICNWENFPLNNKSTHLNIQYFNSIKNAVCPNDVLTPEYDAATVILGSEWRLPTKEDFEELIDNTKHKWVENYNDSGVDGMLFTSKTNSKELFMPETGFRYGTSGARTIMSTIYLWNSSLHSSAGNAFNFYCNDSNACCMLFDDCFYGFCLRGVTKQ